MKHATKHLDYKNQDRKTMTLTVVSIILWCHRLHFFHTALLYFCHITSLSGQGSASETTSPCFLLPVPLEWDEAVDVLMSDKNIFSSQQLSWVVAL